MKLEIYPNLLTKNDIETLMGDINPKETAVDMTYFKETEEKYGCKKVKCSTHHIVQQVINLFPYETESVSIAYYPTGSYNAPHADNCIMENGNIKKIKDWTHTGILFLNDNFDGGKLVYPNQGCIFAPTIGTMVIAPAGANYIHFVEPITRGERFTLVFRFI